MADYTDRLVYQDRIVNIQNAVATFKDYGLVPAIYDTFVGFGENNRKLIFGNKAATSRGSFKYTNPYAEHR